MYNEGFLEILWKRRILLYELGELMEFLCRRPATVHNKRVAYSISLEGWYDMQHLIAWDLWEAVNRHFLDGGGAILYTVLNPSANHSRTLSLSVMRVDPSALKRAVDPDEDES